MLALLSCHQLILQNERNVLTGYGGNLKKQCIDAPLQLRHPTLGNKTEDCRIL